MKHEIIIVFVLLRHMVTQKGNIFCVALLSIMLSIVGILFYSGYLFYDYSKYVGSSNLEIYIKDGADKENIYKIINVLEADQKFIKDIEVFDKDFNSIIGENSEDFNERLLIGKNFEFFSNEAEIILPEYLVYGIEDGQYPIGSYISIDNKDFKLVGIISFSEEDASIVPVHFFMENYMPYLIKCRYKTSLNKLKYKDICKLLESNNCVLKYKFWRKSSPFLNKKFAIKFLRIQFVFIATMINAFVVLYYWIIWFKKDYMIYSICGAEKRKIKRLIITQAMLFINISVLIGNLVYVGLIQIIKQYHLVYVSGYEYYLLVSLFLVCILALFAIYMANKIMTKQGIYRVVE